MSRQVTQAEYNAAVAKEEDLVRRVGRCQGALDAARKDLASLGQPEGCDVDVFIKQLEDEALRVEAEFEAAFIEYERYYAHI